MIFSIARRRQLWLLPFNNRGLGRGGVSVKSVQRRRFACGAVKKSRPKDNPQAGQNLKTIRQGTQTRPDFTVFAIMSSVFYGPPVWQSEQERS